MTEYLYRIVHEDGVWRVYLAHTPGPVSEHLTEADAIAAIETER